MFTTLLFYFIVIMLIVGAVVNIILWIGELIENYKRSSSQKRLMNELSKYNEMY